MAKLYGYTKLSALRGLLRERYEAERRTGEPVFMLPSMANEEPLLDALSADGRYFASRPEVWSWDALYRAIVPPKSLRRQVDPPDHRLILNFILRRTIGELDRAGVPVPPGVRRSGFVDLLSASVRELLLEDVPPDRLLPPPRGGAPDGSPPDGASGGARELLHRLYSDYLLYLEENGLADNAQLPILTRLACAGRERPLERTVLWVGFLSFTGAQRKLVRALEGGGVPMAFFVPDAGLEGFHDAAAQLGLERADAAPREPAVRFATLLARDKYGQFDGIAREIARARADGGEAADDAGVLTNPADLPLMAAALERYGVAWESRAECPVSESALLRAARGAWDAYSRDWPARRTLHLLGSPVFGLGGIDAERLVPRMPEGWKSWREAAARLPDSEKVLRLLDRLKGFCDFVNDPAGHTGEELLHALLALAGEGRWRPRLLAGLSGRKLLDELLRLAEGGEWEERLSREAGDDISLDYAVREAASSRLEVEQKLTLLRELRPALGEAGEVRFRGGEAMAFLTAWSREAATALPQPLTGAVRLYDAPPPVMTSHRLWVMTDVTPARYPGAAADGSLLGAEVRESVNGAAEPDIVHLPTLREKREQKEALFRRLLAVGEELTLLARPANDPQGRPQGDSPFLLSLLAEDALSPSDRGQGDPVPLRGLLPRGQSPKVFLPWEHRGTITAPDQFEIQGLKGDAFKPHCAPSRHAGSGEALPARGPFPRAGVLRREGGGKVRVRLSGLDTWAACPFRYWCERMGLEPPRDVASALDATERGELIHELWRRVWSLWSPGDRTPVPVLAEREWAAMLAEGARSGSPAADPRAAAAVAGIGRMIARAARRSEEIEEAARSSGLVREGVLTEYTLPALEGEHAVFAGRADRIDLWRGSDPAAAPGAVLVDYKLGRSERYKKSLQLAAYAYLMESSESAGERTIEGFGFLGHRDALFRGSWSPAAAPVYKGDRRTRDAPPESVLGEAERALAALDAEIGLGRFEARYDSELCPSCPFGVICRRSEYLSMGRLGEPEEEIDDDESSD